MPGFCQYLNCHNLASSSYQGYCNQSHFERANEVEVLFKIMEQHKHIKTLGEARKFLNSTRSSSHQRSGSGEDVTTSSSRCEECTKSPRG
jgi:hypothetical protein